MNAYKAHEIIKLVNPINDIFGITPTVLYNLLDTFAGRFIINKFPVSPGDYHSWCYNQGGVPKGAYYDEILTRIVIKARYSRLYDAVHDVFLLWFDILDQILGERLEQEAEFMVFTGCTMIP